MLIFVIQIVNAAEVCVVAYSDEEEKVVTSKCLDIDEGKNGYELMEDTGWTLLWTPETGFGHMLCEINDIGTEVSGQWCAYSGDFWNIVLNRDGKLKRLSFLTVIR